MDIQFRAKLVEVLNKLKQDELDLQVQLVMLADDVDERSEGERRAAQARLEKSARAAQRIEQALSAPSSAAPVPDSPPASL